MNVKRYSYRVLWSEEDQEFVGLCAEFPSLSRLAQDQAAALDGIVRSVAEAVQDMQAGGEAIPEPLSLKRYTGKISLRTTPAVHRALALAAAEQGVSLNRHINALLQG